jgi:hypothetical protein
MALTELTITGTFPADQSGACCLTRSGIMVNTTDGTTTTIEPEPVCGVILAGVLYAQDGQSPFTYYADNDQDSEPVGLHSTIAIQIDGAPLDEFDTVVPYTAEDGTIDLSALREAAL